MAKIIKAKSGTVTAENGDTLHLAGEFLNLLQTEVEFQRDREVVDYEGAVSAIIAGWSWVREPCSVSPEPNRLTDSQIADVLEAAADILERDGWTRGTYDHPAGAHCAVGSIRAALRELNISKSREGQVCTKLLPTIKEDPEQKLGQWTDIESYASPSVVIHWNDYVANTRSEVIDLFRGTAKDLRNRAVAE